jgi:hypothetical protein
MTEVDDLSEVQTRRKPIAEHDASRMVYTKRTVPDMQSSSVLYTLAIGLMWRLEVLRTERPKLYLDLLRLRVPVAFARRNPLVKTTFDKNVCGKDGDWSDTATVSVSFSSRETEAEKRAARSTVPVVIAPGSISETAPPEIVASSFEVRYLDLLEIVNLAVSCVSRLAISPNDCHHGDGALPSAGLFESAPDRGGSAPDQWRANAARIAGQQRFRSLDFCSVEAIDRVLRDLYEQEVVDPKAFTTDEDGERRRVCGKRSTVNNLYADPRIRVYATVVDSSEFEKSQWVDASRGATKEDDGFDQVLAAANEDIPKDYNRRERRTFDSRVRFSMTYLQMNTFDECCWVEPRTTTSTNSGAATSSTTTAAGTAISTASRASAAAGIAVGKIFAKKYDSKVQTDLRSKQPAVNVSSTSSASSSSTAALAQPPTSGPSSNSTKNSTDWRDEWAKYIADIVDLACESRGKESLDSKNDLAALFASDQGVKYFRSLMLQRRAALGTVPNCRAVAFHLLDAVDALLVELTDADVAAGENHCVGEQAEQMPGLAMHFKVFSQLRYTNRRLLAYPYDATDSNYAEYEYDSERRGAYSCATERKEVEDAADNAIEATVAEQQVFYFDDIDKVRDEATRNYFAQTYHETSMFEPHYAARRFYRHFLQSLTQSPNSAFAPLIPTETLTNDNSSSSAARSLRALQFTQLFSEHYLPEHLKSAAHADLFDADSIEHALDNGFLLTFLADPFNGVDSSRSNQYNTLYSMAVRPERNPFCRFAEQVEHYLFGERADRAAVLERYPSIARYVNQYIVPRLHNARLFRPNSRNVGAQLLPLMEMVELRLRKLVAETAALAKMSSTATASQLYSHQSMLAMLSALRGERNKWSGLEPALRLHVADESEIVEQNARTLRYHMRLEKPASVEVLRAAAEHSTRDHWNRATAFVRAILDCPAPFLRRSDLTEPFSLLYDYGVYCIDRKLKKRVAKNAAIMTRSIIVDDNDEEVGQSNVIDANDDDNDTKETDTKAPESSARLIVGKKKQRRISAVAADQSIVTACATTIGASIAKLASGNTTTASIQRKHEEKEERRLFAFDSDDD